MIDHVIIRVNSRPASGAGVFDQSQCGVTFRSDDDIETAVAFDIEEAEVLFRKAISDSPNYGLPYKYLGDINNLNRDLVKAVENWEKYMELSPNESHLVFDSIETALFDLGRYSEVEKFYRKVLNENPYDINAGLRLANVLNEKGENKSAIALIDQFIDRNNSSISVMLMKLKLSLFTQTPAELNYYLDEIINKIKDEQNK